MRRTPWRAVSLVLALGLALISCDGPSRGTNTQPSAASGFQVVVTATPNVLRASEEGDGGCGVVQVKVFDRQGQLVDGAIVSVTRTVGIFKFPDDVVGVTAPTTRGLLSVGFCAQQERGTSIITATAEDAVATTTVTIF